jgi:phosphoenolpyruvate-protein kinase (PTS system EI component)
MKKVLDKPVQIAGRQLAGVFEDFGGATVHSKIVARNRA